jgi:hypothetical protein
MNTQTPTPTAHPAIVARHVRTGGAADEYLVLAPDGAASWTADTRIATAFASMREATRAALRLSGAGPTFGLPLGPELALSGLH